MLDINATFGFILGDGVWEGLRLVDGDVPFLREHIERLYEGSKAIFMAIGLTPDKLVQRLFYCADHKAAEDGLHEIQWQRFQNC